MISLNKKFSIAFVFLFFLSAKSFSLGIGIITGVSPGVTFNSNGTPQQQLDCTYTLKGSLKGFRLPYVYSMGAEFGTKSGVTTFGLNTTFDYNLIDKQLYNTWNLYAGAGINGDIVYCFNNSVTFGIGPRLYIGTNFSVLAGTFEPFLQVAVNPNFNFNTQSYYSFELNIPVELGLRFHF